MTDAEACRKLRAAGWRLVRQKGSHLVMTRAGERLVAAVGRRGKRGLSPGLRAAVRRATEGRP